ncbi:MAG: DNA cytosine methyltransferase [Clostridia bacterium]|nr:DNA cytosine methyltransferase [Clostridia bacterium]
MESYKVGSMFAGIGGICLGFKQAGADIVWANEIDKNACITYRTNFGDSYLVEDDIKNVKTSDIPDIDILTAGFPCQPFSIAGYQKGFIDDRGNLFFEIIRVLKDKKPKAILLENVKNLASHDNGHTFEVIANALRKNGYFIKKDILNTADYGNVPQNRERIYIVGFRDEKQCERFSFPEPIKLTKSIYDVIKFDEKKEDLYYYNKTKYYDILKETMQNQDTVYQWRRIYCRENKNKLCPTLTANMGTGGHNVPLIKDNYDIRKLTPKECLLFQGFPIDYKIPSNLSNSHIYKQAGNAVSVPVIERIAENIMKVLNEKKYFKFEQR